jgi:hypothetical protein
MVSSRAVEYQGLRVTVKPYPTRPEARGLDRYLFLTGNSSTFQLVVENITDKWILGKIAIRFAYSGLNTSDVLSNEYVATIDLKPNKYMVTEFNERHQFDGQVVVSLCHIGNLEELLDIDNDEIGRCAKYSTGEVLCAYKVIDEVTYHIENKRFEELQDQIRNLENKLTDQIDQTIRARLSEMGFSSSNFKLDVAREKISTGQEQPTKMRSEEPVYIR